MSKIRLRSRKKAALALAVTGALSAAVISTVANRASADPQIAAGKVGVGSDTIQDIDNALSGRAVGTPPKAFLPIFATAANGAAQIQSWDAVPSGCITPKLGAPAIDRPNGSGAGINALLAAINGTAFGGVTCAGGAKVIGAANIDFARSSRGPNVLTPNTLTFIPFARDAVMYVYETNGTDDISNLSTSDIASGYSDTTNGDFTPTGGATVNVHVCLPQVGSGTRSFWEGAVGVPDGTAALAAAANGCNTTLEEHDGNGFDTFAQTFLSTRPNSAVLIPFSVSQWVAQANGFGVDRSATFRTSGRANFGDPDNIGGATGPFSAGPPLAGNSTYYNFVSATNPVGTYGRDVFNVVKTTKLGNTIGQRDLGLQDLLNATTQATANTNPNGVCVNAGARTTVHNFGFLDPLLPCGSVGTTGAS